MRLAAPAIRTVRFVPPLDFCVIACGYPDPPGPVGVGRPAAGPGTCEAGGASRRGVLQGQGGRPAEERDRDALGGLLGDRQLRFPFPFRRAFHDLFYANSAYLRMVPGEYCQVFPRHCSGVSRCDSCACLPRSAGR